MSESLSETATSETTSISSPLPLAYANAFTNQQLIDAFFDTANTFHNGDYQGLLNRAALNINQLAADRSGRFAGPRLNELPNLSDAERASIHASLLRQLQRRATLGQVSAPDGLNLRVGPSREHEVIASLPVGSEVTILSEDGEWLLGSVGDQTGWLFAAMVSRTPTSGSANLVTTMTSSALAPTTRLEPPPDASPHVVGAATTWNEYGALILSESNRLTIDPAVAVAILGVESSGRAFENGRMVIRFENHIFHHYVNEAQRDLAARHFTASSNGNEHRWRPDANGEWQPCHTSQATEWQTFDFARAIDEQAALYAISMGAAQIMGFNHAAIGYPSARAMFDAFQSDVRNQLLALFRFIETNHLQAAVRKPDFVAFARAYNGHGQETIYAPRMQRYYDAYRQLVATGRLPQPGAPAIFNADPELLAAWRKYIAASLANNQTVFQRLLDGFLRPYWTTVWMYRILFALGVLSFVLAAALAIFTGRSGSVMLFGGLSAIVVLGYFFSRPIQGLEQNLHFLAWLGIIYNSYWTRLTLLNNEATIQRDISDVTDEAVARIQALAAEHAKHSATRQGLKLPFGEG